jgi:hypothetical protein
MVAFSGMLDGKILSMRCLMRRQFLDYRILVVPFAFGMFDGNTIMLYRALVRLIYHDDIMVMNLTTICYVLDNKEEF